MVLAEARTIDARTAEWVVRRWHADGGGRKDPGEKCTCNFDGHTESDTDSDAQSQRVIERDTGTSTI